MDHLPNGVGDIFFSDVQAFMPNRNWSLKANVIVHVAAILNTFWPQLCHCLTLQFLDNFIPMSCLLAGLIDWV